MYKTRIHPYLYDNSKRESFLEEFRRNQEVIFPETPRRRTELKDFVRSLLEKDVHKRLSWEDIFQHPLLVPSKETQLTYEKLSLELVRKSKRF
jgi:serine/threonine protein kinase